MVRGVAPRRTRDELVWLSYRFERTSVGQGACTRIRVLQGDGTGRAVEELVRHSTRPRECACSFSSANAGVEGL
ncbi:uncharacterized protein STAUR_6004 [Stigmatella aurantiaca DW4/3-1]|uniref:Uncharacterized protein n=1 Tax=Stigmatella aurantiaca (strain DW4/3-1) TaxID=378806 RepID=E3G0J9_STIAD|nr:uncharacterized protein STAUR_6004 [Stigmatella aurantiaca DW4/3-1]